MNQKQHPLKPEHSPLLLAIQRVDFKATEARLQPLSPPAALEALLAVWQELEKLGQRRRRLSWMTWPALTVLFGAGCRPCLGTGGAEDLAVVVVLATVMAGIATLLLSLFGRPNYHHALHYLRATLKRVDSAQCVSPLLALAAEPGLAELHSAIWLKLAELLPRLSDDDLFALTPEQRTLLVRNCERNHDSNLTLAVLLVFTSLKDPALKDKTERWLRFRDERLQEATHDYLKAIE